MKLLRFLLLLVVVACGVTARESLEEKQQRRAAADAADKSIRFLGLSSVQKTIATGTWVVFFGANWCKFTQKLTPKWLQVQQKFDQLDQKVLRIGKVDCAADESICSKQFKVDAYPTLLLFKNGKMVEEYSDEDEVEPLYQYLSTLVQKESESQQAQVMESQAAQPKTNKVNTNSTNSQWPISSIFAIAGVCGIALVIARMYRQPSRSQGYERV